MSEEETIQVGRPDRGAWIVIGLVLFFFSVLIGARLFFNPVPEAETIIYNNFEFTKVGGLWFTKWQKGNELFQVPLRFNPLEVDDVEITGKLAADFSSPGLFITFDPTSQEEYAHTALAASEISSNLATVFDVHPQPACTKEHESCTNFSIVTCESDDKAVIFLNETGEAAIIMKGNCITLQGKDFELLKATDRLIYQWYGIMK